MPGSPGALRIAAPTSRTDRYPPPSATSFSSPPSPPLSPTAAAQSRAWSLSCSSSRRAEAADAGLFPLKVNGVIVQWISIEDYGDLNESEDRRVEPPDSGNKRNWGAATPVVPRAATTG